MKKLIKLSLLAIFLGIHPTGCYNKSCDDLYSYTISDIGIVTKHIYNLNESSIYQAPQTDPTKYYKVDSIGFLMDIKDFNIGLLDTKSSFNGFQSMAIACEPRTRYENSIEGIQALYSGNNVVFNDTLQLKFGDDITNLFNITNSFGSYQYPMSLQNFSSSPYMGVDESFFLTFATSNNDSLEFRFNLITTLSDGKVLKSEDLMVNLLPSNK